MSFTTLQRTIRDGTGVEHVLTPYRHDVRAVHVPGSNALYTRVSCIRGRALTALQHLALPTERGARKSDDILWLVLLRAALQAAKQHKSAVSKREFFSAEEL